MPKQAFRLQYVRILRQMSEPINKAGNGENSLSKTNLHEFLPCLRTK